MSKIPSVMPSQARFAQVPSAEIPRSVFDRSHGYKTTFDAGYLIPFYVDEALPGDTFSLNMTGFARLATPLHPFMDNLFMTTHFFAVPIRLLWDNWERFNGAQTDPDDPTDFMIPVINAPAETGFAAGSIYDYLGIPVGVTGFDISALYLRAYNLIWNEWFRDQNLQDSLPVPRGDAADAANLYTLQRRGKRHDYFTSCLPWPQKGESVDIPLGQFAPISGNIDIVSNGLAPLWSTSGAGINKNNQALSAVTGTANVQMAVPLVTISNKDLFFGDSDQTGLETDWSLIADLSDATAATINQLRQAFQVQKLLERDARGGTRYTELLRAHFGVVSPDARLQRPEYLGGGQTPVNLSAVAQTSSVPSQPTPQGNLAAFGTAMLSGHSFSKSFVEHSIIIGLVSTRADLNYQQGLNRMWSRRLRYDFYWPALAHIGEQAVLNREIYTQGTAADNLVFGYQERFAEYRYKPSMITGEMRSTFPQSLDTWHLAQDFDTLPVLNESFIVDNPPVERVIAVPSSPHFIFDSYLQLRCARPMPVYGVPGFIDRF